MKVGPCSITYKGEVLGITSGSSVLTFKFTNYDVKVNRTHEQIIDKRLTGVHIYFKTEIFQIDKGISHLLNENKTWTLADIDIYKAKDKIIVAAKNRIYNDIMEKAAKIYEKVYFHAGNSYIKRPLSETDIANLLRKKDSLEKLKLFGKKLDTVAKVFSKVDKVINMSDRAIKILDIYSEGGKVLEQSNRLNTSKDFKNYYYKVAQEASKTASILKSFSSKLPPGMRDYYEFIFTVAENTDKMAKVVYDYTTKLEKAMEELDKDVRRNQESRSVKAGDYSNLKENKNTNAATAGELVDVFYGGKRRKRH